MTQRRVAAKAPPAGACLIAPREKRGGAGRAIHLPTPSDGNASDCFFLLFPHLTWSAAGLSTGPENFATSSSHFLQRRGAVAGQV